jgi:hypothetical protein
LLEVTAGQPPVIKSFRLAKSPTFSTLMKNPKTSKLTQEQKAQVLGDPQLRREPPNHS